MERRKLSDVAYLLNGYAFKSAKYVECGIRIMRIANVQDGYIADEKPCFYPFNTNEDISKYMLTENDLLVSLTGNVGRVGMLTKGFLPAALNQRVSCIRIKDSKVIDRKYLYYYLRQKNFIQECIEASKGVAQLNLSSKWLENYVILVPSLQEQKRIVTRIEELFSQLDAGVETLKKIKAQLTVYRQAVLKEAFEGIDSYTQLGQISNRMFDGPFGTNLKTVDYTDRGVRVVRLENIKTAWFDDSKKSYVTAEKYETIKTHTVVPSDLIMSTFISDSIKVCQLPTYLGYAVNKADCIGIRLKSEIVPKYVMYYLSSKLAYNALIQQVHGATRPRVNTKQIKAMIIPIVGTNEQEKIVDKIESHLSVCDSIEQTVETVLRQAEAMRQSILKQAFEGKL